MSNDGEYGILLHEKLSDCISVNNTTTDEEKESTSVDLVICTSDSDTSLEDNDYFIEAESRQTRLKERLATLQIALETLQEQLKEETNLWRKEVEETILLQRQQEEKLDEFCSEHHLTHSEYFQRQSLQLQEAILKAQAAKRAKIQREIAITSYKTQLLQVENMCNLELTRVKQSKQNLQPLQMIASEWKMNDKGDFNRDEERHDNENISTANSQLSIEDSVKELYNNMDEMFNELAFKFAAAGSEFVFQCELNENCQAAAAEIQYENV
ncbi:unnamed protein product [Brassicogethes aeneus]|uniref:Uncharacterized protein n=1 Tax=Brassicogethes aeneus TaxID=1431903 RepID=A0A9P0BD56_BRAAE|nr:unnamed protein product [Brassicogethes aeneus]